MKDISLITYHLGGIALLFFFPILAFIHRIAENYASFVSLNAGFVYNPNLIILVDIAVTVWVLSILYRLRHKVGRNFLLGLSSAMILTVSFLAMAYLIIIYVGSQIRLF